jgi:hypothetical protein
MPTLPLGTDVDTIVNPELIVALNSLVAVCGGVELSVTRAVNVNAPASAGVPVMTPAGLIASPSGNGPAAAHV